MDHPPTLPSVAQPKTSGLAIWSLVLGILSLTCFWLLAAIPAVICGHMAFGRIKRAAGALEGKGVALAGLITGYLSIALSVFILPLMLAIAIPNFVKARKMVQTTQCVINLRQLESAKEQWAQEHKKEPADIPQQSDLLPYLGSSFPVCPSGGVYTINAVDQKPACSIPDHQLPKD
jgi:general secretion pathway protein G